jgi:rhodanese-related sulfurtransferase
MKLYAYILIFLILSCNSQAQVPDSLQFKSVPPVVFDSEYRNSDKAFLIDVREYFEFKKSRIKTAINIPSSDNFDIPADTINKDSDLFFYCTSGFRSKKIARLFYEKGFTHLYSLDGGINAWKKEDLPVDKKRIRKKK